MRRLTLIYFAFPLVLFTAEIDTVLVYSQAMQKEAPVVIIMPDSYQSDTELFPVVYLLHGHSGNHLDWISNMDVGAAADRYGFIGCPVTTPLIERTEGGRLDSEISGEHGGFVCLCLL